MVCFYGYKKRDSGALLIFTIFTGSLKLFIVMTWNENMTLEAIRVNIVGL